MKYVVDDRHILAFSVHNKTTATTTTPKDIVIGIEIHLRVEYFCWGVGVLRTVLRASFNRTRHPKSETSSRKSLTGQNSRKNRLLEWLRESPRKWCPVLFFVWNSALFAFVVCVCVCVGRVRGLFREVAVFHVQQPAKYILVKRGIVLFSIMMRYASILCVWVMLFPSFTQCLLSVAVHNQVVRDVCSLLVPLSHGLFERRKYTDTKRKSHRAENLFQFTMIYVVNYWFLMYLCLLPRHLLTTLQRSYDHNVFITMLYKQIVSLQRKLRCHR